MTGILRGGLDPKEILSETNSSFAPENRLGPHKENFIFQSLSFNGYVSFREGNISIGNSKKLFIFQDPYGKLSVSVSEKVSDVEFRHTFREVFFLQGI